MRRGPDRRCPRSPAIRKVRRPLVLAAALALGILLATTLAAVAATNLTVSPRDNCGGFNGHVVWTGRGSPYIELYGEVWENKCSGTTSVWLAWDSPSYHNINLKAAAESQTEGLNYKTGTSATPTNIKVTVCSTLGGWHCGTPVAVPPGGSGTGTTPTTTTPPPPPPTPVATTPVTTPVPTPPPAPRALRAIMKLTWTYNRASTRLHKATIGSIPGGTRLVVRCVGHGCPHPATVSATDRSRIRRLLRRLRGRRYHAGDKLLITLQAPGWRSERAQVTIRWGKLPKARLLRS